MGKLVNVRSSAEYNRPREPDEPVTPSRQHPLDMERPRARLKKIEEWLETERLRQAPNRFQMALDEDFYDNLQWSEDDAAILMERGQAPLVYNWTKATVDWVRGTEMRTRIDFKVLPRSAGDRNEAENKTKVMKYLSDVNKSPFHRSRSFGEAVKVGVGWLECGLREDPTKEIIYDRHESWRHMLHDSFGHDRDLGDARYLFRMKSVDIDIAEEMIPDRRFQLRSAAVQSDIASLDNEDEYYLGERLSVADREVQSAVGRHIHSDASSSLFNRRERVKLYEAWYKMPARMKFLIAGPLHGAKFDPASDYHRWLLQQKSTTIIERVAMQMRCALFIRGTLLADAESPYRHNEFPFTPIWGNVRGRDNQPYGMIRVMRDPQESFNKRMSKVLHALSTRRVFMDAGAVEDAEEVREEAARPDSVFVVRPGMRFELDTDTEVAKAHGEYAQVDARMIQNSGGVTDENLGRQTNAHSGKAIEARQDQGSVVTTPYFDNYRFAFQGHGQKILSLAEQFITWERKIRVIGERYGYDFIEINKPGQDDQGNPILLNDITATQADFIVSAQDFRESMRQAGFEVLMDFVGKLAAIDPKIALMVVDDVLEYGDLPGAEALIQTIREINGKPPRDKRPSQEEEAAMAQAKQREDAKAKIAEHIALKQAALTVKEQAAKVRELEAKAMKLVAEAQTMGLDGEAKRQYDEKVTKLRDDTKKLVDSLVDQVRQAKADADVRHAEIERKYSTEVEIAMNNNASEERIAALKEEHEDARADLQKRTAENVAAISRASDNDAQALKAQFDEVKAMADEAKKLAEEARADADEAQKTADEAKKEAEQRVKELEGELRETEKRARDDAARAVETVQKQVDKQTEQQAAQADAEPAAPAPIVIVVPGSDGEEREIDIQLATDAQGKITGAKGTSKKRAAKKTTKPAGKKS